MPELPEVETICRSLASTLKGTRLGEVTVRDTRLRRPVDRKKLVATIVGRQVLSLSRRAKYLFLDLEGEIVLVFHLGMSGRLLVLPSQTPLHTHDHVIFGLQDGRQLRFRDPRRFGLVEVFDRDSLLRATYLKDLGMEPLSREFDQDFLFEKTRRLKKPIKNFLMDAHKIVGVGNIYANEGLFLAGIRPGRPVGRLTRSECGKICLAVKQVLKEAIRQGGTTISDFYNSNGARGLFQEQLRVYDRAGKPCMDCGQKIRRQMMAGRSTFYCGNCQR